MVEEIGPSAKQCPSVLIDQNVLQQQIWMNDVVLVGIGQRLYDLTSEVECRSLGKRAIFGDIGKKVALGALWK